MAKGRAKGKKRKGAAFHPLAEMWDGRRQDVAGLALLLLFTGLLFGRFLFSDGMLFGSDTLPMGYAARKVFTDLVKSTGSLPLWNPYLLGGIPMVDGLMGGDMFYPTTLLQFIMPVYRALGVKLVFHILLAGWLFFLYMRNSGCRRAAALVGGAGYAFAPYIVSLIYAGHDGKLFVTALLPFGFLALDRLIDHRRFADMLLFGAAVGLMILTAHLQLAFFACGAFTFRFLWKGAAAWRRGERNEVLRGAVVFACGALLGAAIGAVQTWPAYRYTSTFSPRAGGVTYEFATSWSIHWEEAVSMILPDFGGYLNGYWGENPFKLNCESPGIVIAGFVIAGFFHLGRRKDLRFWYFLLAGTLVYGLGAETPFFHLIYAVVPRFFRAPSTVLFLFSFASAVIAAFLLDDWFSGKGRGETLKGLAVAGAVVLLLFLFASAGEPFYRAWGSAFRGDLPPEKLAAAVGNAGRVQLSALLALLSIGAVVALLEGSWRRRWPAEATAAGIALVVFFSDWRTDADFVRAVRLGDYIREDGAVSAMRNDDSIFRATSFLPNYRDNVLGIFGIEAARGFFDNRIRWYDELIAGKNLNNFGLLSLLNVKYLLIPPPGGDFPTLEEVVREKDRILYKNRTVLPRAFLADRFEVIPDRGKLLRAMLDPGADLAGTVYLDVDPLIESGGGGGDLPPVKWIEKGPNRYTVATDADRPSILLVSNNYLPYWKASVDGEPAPLLRADYALQAVALPPGSHEVSLVFRSGPYAAGRAVTLAGCLFLLAGGTTAFFRRGRGEGEEKR